MNTKNKTFIDTLNTNRESHIDCLNYSIYKDKLEDIVPIKGKLLINTLNQYSYCIAEKDEEFKKALLESNILLPDGIGIVLAARFLNGKKIKKIAGFDLHIFLLKKLNLEHGSCFYLGASVQTLLKIKERISKEYPNVTVSTYSPPFKNKFSKGDSDKMIEAINVFNPDILFVGMTAPKQEKWCQHHKHVLNTKIICSIGAVFDFYAGTVNRPNQIWINLGLEWLGRLFKEPKRMWKRYIYYGIVFGYYVLKKIYIVKSDKKTELTR